MYQKEHEKQLNFENVVEVESSKEEKQKKPRATRKRCLVWPRYESFVNDQGEPKGKCPYCAKEYCSDTKIHGTSTLRGHLKIFGKFLVSDIVGSSLTKHIYYLYKTRFS